MPRTLVFKSNRSFNADDRGTVVPVAIENDDGSLRAVSPDEYPNNNRIFISKDFSKIDSAFSDRELFVLTTVHEGNDDDGMDSPSRSKYYSMGYYASALDTNTYLPIISMAMPDVASGRVDHGPSQDIGSKPFFILSNDIVAGPFVAQAEEDTWLITPMNSMSPLALSSYHIAQFELGELEKAGLILRSSLGGYERLYFTSLKRAKEEVEFDSKDYISDSALIRLFAKMDYGRGVGSLTKTEATKLASIIDAYRKKTKVAGDTDRAKRLESVLDEYMRFDGVGVDVIQSYLSTKPGKLFLEEYATANRESLLKDTLASIEQKHTAQREKYERETAEVLAKLDTKRQELQHFELESDRRRKEIAARMDELSTQSREQEQSALRDRNNKLMSEIEQNEKLLVELKKEVGDYKDVSSRRKEKEKMQLNVEILRDEEYKLKGLIDTQLNLIRNPQVNDRLVEFRTMQMLLNGISPETSEVVVRPIELPAYTHQVTGETRKSYVESLRLAFSKTHGRPYSYDDTANLLLSTLQSYLTILAGPPGTGKTSSAYRFAEALGLTAANKSSVEVDNFLSIPVGRGWVSSRDMLGFYNSLKGVYQPSRSGLYQYLKAFQDASPELASDYLKLVLLDEANLSSIEHYWSDFLLMCDTFERGHRIDLGVVSKKDRYLDVPPSLRFIATINNDATVEGLSNRLIDRASIITLGHSGENSAADMQAEFASGAVPYQELVAAFIPKADEEELEDIDALRLNQVLEIMSTNSIKGAQLHFSQRKISAITKYCYIAGQLGYEKTQPLDFAISQHVLPAISGHGQGLRERLQLLSAKLEDLDYSVSRKIVNNIIEAGDDFSDSYSFF